MIKMKKKKYLRSQHCTYWATGGAEDDMTAKPRTGPTKSSDNKNWNLTALSEGGESKLKVLSLSYIGYCVMFFFFFFEILSDLNQAVPIHLGYYAFDSRLQGE